MDIIENNERDRSYRDIIAEKINPYTIIPKDVFKKNNDGKLWRKQKYEKIHENLICISSNGTIGEIWKVGKLYIGVPDSKDEEILNKNIHDDNSIWQRTEIPKEFIELERDYKKDMRVAKPNQRDTVRQRYTNNKIKLEEKYKKFIDKEWERRKNGLFIKIDNEVVYLTGENYMFLNYYYLAEDKIYPNFRMTAVHTWWHWEAVKVDKHAWGELRLKSRRVAWTSESCSIALNTLTQTTYAEIPVVSETDRLAKALFTKKIVNPFKYYPTYFKPVIEQPNDIVKNNLEITFDTLDQETSAISFYPTKAVSYDSTKASTGGINDEVGKYTNVTFTEFRGNHSDCYKQGTRIVSTGRFGSTAGDFSNGGESFKYEFENANADKRDKFGSTLTGLIALFVDDCYTTAGMFDKWGFPIVKDPISPIENEYGEIVEFGAITMWNVESEKKKQGKKSDYNNYLRQHPRTPEHAFRNEGGINNDFDIVNLNNHIDYLDTLNEHDLKEIIFRGNLRWVGEKFTSDVMWIPHTKGKFHTTYIPPTELQNKSSVREFHGRQLRMPDNNHIGCFGVDSYDIGTTADGKGSDGALVGYTKFSMTGAPSHSFFLKYVERPDKRDDFYEDIIMACKFWGMFALVESNKPRLLEFMSDNGFRGYSMTRPDKKWKDLSPFEKDFGGIPSSKQTNKDQASLLKDYIFDMIGQDLENECRVYFKDMVEEWVGFDVNNRTKSDMTVAGQLALLGSQYEVKQRKSLNIGNNNGISLSSFGA